VFVNTPIETCESRDPKGLYKKARAAVASGKGLGFTGIDDPYETPTKPEITIDTASVSPQEAAAGIMAYLTKAGLV
jgi:adenylylsulfate kinase